MTDPRAQWQCVFVLWGTKYPARLVLRLAEAVRARSTRPARFVLITDRARPELPGWIEQRDFAPGFLAPAHLRAGCQAKLTLFAPGVVADDLPAVFLDLDTVVLGDLSRAVGLLRDPRHVHILPSGIFRFGPIARAVARLTGGRRHVRGNSSMIVWQPGQGADIAARFLEMSAADPEARFKPLRADDRFLSWAAQERMRVVPDDLVVKLRGEFMHPVAGWLRLKARLPWVRARRARLAAVTLPGEAVKPEALLALPEGARLRDERGRVLIWSDAVLGPVRRRIIAFYADGADGGPGRDG